MAIKIVGVLCFIACSTASHFAYDYSPVYHQQPIAYVQQPAIYQAASPIATQITPAATLATAPPLVPALRHVDYISGPAKYDFSYGVHDSLTGDIKSQRESRDGGNVQGSYSLIDSDGFKRTVTYTADDVNGFNAIVQREPLVGLATPIVPAQIPQSQYLPIAQAPIQVPIQAPAPVSVSVPVQAPVASAPAEVPLPVQEPAPVEQPIEEAEIVPQQPQEIPQPEIDNFQDVPQSDDDSEVIDAFGAAARSASGNIVSSTESSLNQEEVAPQEQQK